MKKLFKMFLAIGIMMALVVPNIYADTNYEVSYDNDGDSQTANVTQNMAEGCSIKKNFNDGETQAEIIELTGDLTIENPTREGYNFTGWSIVDPTDYDLELNANWEIKRYNVSFDDDGNEETAKIVKNLEYGAIIDEDFQYFIGEEQQGEIFRLTQDVEIENLTREGYIFKGWKVIDDSGDLVLEAKWQVKTYTVTFNSNTESASTVEQSFNFGEWKDLTKNSFENEGYVFVKWTTNQDGTGTEYADEELVHNLVNEDNGNLNLYAQWRPLNNYEVSYDNDGNNQTPNVTKTLVEGSIIRKDFLDGETQGEEIEVDEDIVISNPSRQYYNFIGWSEVQQSEYGLELEANWEIKNYTVIFNSNTGDTNEQTFDFNEEKKLEKNSFRKTGYSFVKWNTKKDGTGTDYQDEQLVSNLVSENNDNINLYAQWQPIKYTVKFHSNNENDNTVTQIFSYDEQKKLTKNSFEKAHYEFMKWTTREDGTGTEYEDEAFVKNLLSQNNGNLDLYAQWEKSAVYIENIKATNGENITQKLVDALNASKDYVQRVISIPSGTYLIGDNNNLVIPSNTRLVLQADTELKKISSTYSILRTRKDDNVNNITITGGTLNCNNMGVNGIEILSAQNVTISNVKLINAGNNRNGISISNSKNISLSNIETSNNKKCGIYISNSTGSIKDSKSYSNATNGVMIVDKSNVEIDKLTTYSNTQDGLYINNSAATVSNSNSNKNGGNGIYINSSTVPVKNTKTYSNKKDGIEVVTSSNSSIDNLESYSNTGNGVYVINSTATLTNATSRNNKLGVYINNSTINKFEKNYIYDNSASGMFITNNPKRITLQNVRVNGNKANGIEISASTATLNYCNVYSNTNCGIYVNQKSTVNINNNNVYNSGKKRNFNSKFIKSIFKEFRNS